ncbi:MAG TPA: GAF and ANTAR domain-containing protein [Pseudonocardia sp.]|nr:GAF and ANTAR domain-containing protein [Pseudonocardia sp.]
MTVHSAPTPPDDARLAASDADPETGVATAGGELGLLAEMLLRAESIEDFLSELAQRAVGDVDAALSCGISVNGIPTSRLLAAASDDFARRMDEIQYELDDGPCRACLRDNVAVEVEDIAGDDRWPAFRERGLAENAGACLSIPLSVGQHSVGALNVYARVPGGFSASARNRAQNLAVHAAGAVALAARFVEYEERTRHLQTALSSRSAIDHAVGILMGRHRISPSAAFELLRQASQHTNTKLRDVAARLIIDATGHPPHVGPTPRV